MEPRIHGIQSSCGLRSSLRQRQRCSGAAPPPPRRRAAPPPPRAFTLKRGGSGEALEFGDKPSVSVGSAPDADVVVPGAEAAHAVLTTKGRQLFLTALVGEEVFDSSATWIDGDEARPRVAYVLSSGSTLEFGARGAPGAAFAVAFEEPSGANPLVEMLLRGAAAGASDEVRRALDGGP
ncbi:hypothetical protein Rsub_10927 [Raphidocelis subcapitata]|uniref:FHA domain-containing protein n=1 Tax=Raphidocelis subcapitata TaxID=307507 RepID=A0A2V0PEJ4_9CHLO|nr:hypothetical protein Rsub_10927 [Raphidocelis subcapitata]|eukprot:GBF98264.1 hypothetical protein Rsub_10927 [Raphidocelis subcapitata]